MYDESNITVKPTYKKDRRVWLQLPQEERQILEELLNPDVTQKNKPRTAKQIPARSPLGKALSLAVDSDPRENLKTLRIMASICT